MSLLGNESSGTGLLGIDLGTSSVKAAVTDEGAAVLAESVRPYPVAHPHQGWSESAPEDWWRAVVEAVREAVAGAGRSVAAIGLSGQMHGVVLAGADGRAVRPAVLWSDARAAAQVEAYRALPAWDRLRLANPLSPGMFGPIVAWLGRHEPRAVDAARWALSPKDWIRLRLTGVAATDPSDASATLLYDVPGDRWGDDIAAAVGVPPRLLPPITASAATNAGTLAAAPAGELGLPPGIPVAAGGGDTAVAAVGAGVVRQGQAQLTIGTGIQIVAPVSTIDTINAISTRGGGLDHPVTHLYRAATDTGWYRMAAGLNGGATLAWVRGLFGASWEEMYATASDPTQPDDPLFLPQLAGERTPYLDPDLRGGWAYLDPRHDRTAMLRSALEGVAHATRAAWIALRDNGCAAPVLRLAGGGTAAPAWRQRLADTLQVTLEPVDVVGASARGAAVLGGRAAGILTAAQEMSLVETPTTTPPVVPDTGAASVAAERFERFERLLEAQRAAR